MDLLQVVLPYYRHSLTMGPASRTYLPNRPKVCWYAKYASWSDEKGEQEQYSNYVNLWNAFNEALPDNNNIKITENIRTIILMSQLYDRTKNLCSGFINDYLLVEDVVKKIIEAKYQRDALSIVSEQFCSLNVLCNTRRRKNESMKNFESRFSAQVSNLNSSEETEKLPECVKALIILYNSSIDDNQSVSLMVAAATSNKSLTGQSKNDQCFARITYNSVESVPKQCDKSSQSFTEQTHLNLSSDGTNPGFNKRPRNFQSIPSKADFEVLKMCHQCNK